MNKRDRPHPQPDPAAGYVNSARRRVSTGCG